MSPEPRVWRDRIRETGTAWHRARLVDRNRNVLTQSDFTGSVTKRVFDLSSDDADTAIASNTSNISAVIFNALQSWEDDARGYNLEMPTTSNQVGGWNGAHTYRVEISLTRVAASGDGVMTEVFEIEPDDLRSS